MSMKNYDEHKIAKGERIKSLRERLGLTLKVFSEPLSVGLGTVNNYEHGIASPSEAVLRQLETIYMMNRNWFETGEGEMILSPEPVVEYNNSDHEEDNEFVKPVTRYEFEQFSSLRPDQKKMLAVWENLDCEQRIALMAWAKLFTKG